MQISFIQNDFKKVRFHKKYDLSHKVFKIWRSG